MMDFSYRLSIPKIKCGESLSSGFLVSKNIIITALHSINPYLTKDAADVKVIFIDEEGREREISAMPLLQDDGRWKDYQIIALELKEEVNDINILECMDYKFNAPADCYTYGYPAVRSLNGTWIDLEIKDEIKKNVDTSYDENLDVKVKFDTLKDYRGCSGGPLLYRDRVIGVMLEQSSENGEAGRLSAVSLYLYSEYFRWLGVNLIKKEYDLDYEAYLKAKKQHFQTKLGTPIRRDVKRTEVNPLGFPLKIHSGKNSNELYDFTSLLENNDSILVFSEPGGGKTYLLSMLMLELIENPIHLQGKIPVFLKAKDWFRAYKSILEGIKSELIYEFAELTDKYILDALKKGKFILLIDGFDEIRTNKDLFITEVEDLTRFENLKIIITCRQQNYYNELDKFFSEYLLQPLIDEQIIEYAAAAYEEAISYSFVHSLRKVLKKLIETPLFLYMTIEVIKSTGKGMIPKNKAELYDIFIDYMMQHRIHNSGIEEETRYDQKLKLEILADYAYTNFSNPNDIQSFSEVASKYVDYQNILPLKRELIRTGVVIEERNDLEFFHPSIEEYFTALMISKMDEQKIMICIQENHIKEAYTEIFKFVSGLLRNAKKQNVVLDKLEKTNVYLYRLCLESRFNFDNIIEEWPKQYLIDYLKQLRKSYLLIIETFFKSIKSEFYPWRKEKQNVISNEDIIIVGSLDVDTSSLAVEIDSGKDEEKVKVMEVSAAPAIVKKDEDGKELHIPIIKSNAGSYWYFDLSATDLGLDSAREVAMYIIKDQLKKLIKEQELFDYESPESIVPCIEYILSSLPEKYFSVQQNGQRKIVSLYEHTVDTIIKVLTFDDNIMKHIESRRTYGHLKRDYVLSIMYKFFDLARQGVEFKDYLLPREDLEPDLGGRNSYSIWEAWSDGRVKDRLRVFFDFYQRSYRALVENCFSAFSEYIPLYSMGPVRYQIGLERDESGAGGISCSWEPVKSMNEALPNIEDKKEKILFNETEEKKAELSRKLRQLNRKPLKGYTFSSSALSTYINDERDGLRKKVYDQIFKDLEYVLGKIK